MRRSHGEAVSGAAQVMKELPTRSLPQLLSGNLDFVRRNVGFVRNFGVCLDSTLVPLATNTLMKFWKPERDLCQC